MRFIETEGRWRRLELTPADLDLLQKGGSISDLRSVIVYVAPEIKLKTWVMRSEHCSNCDRPELCAVIKERSAPCGRNRHVSLEERK